MSAKNSSIFEKSFSIRKNMSLISIIFSFRNEEEVLPILMRRVTEALQSIPEDLELIFVDDASTDDSVHTIEELAKEVTNVRLIQMTRRFGVEECFSRRP